MRRLLSNYFDLLLKVCWCCLPKIITISSCSLKQQLAKVGAFSEIQLFLMFFSAGSAVKVLNGGRLRVMWVPQSGSGTKPQLPNNSDACQNASIWKKAKVKEGHTLKDRRRDAHLPFIGRWARRWKNHYCLWHMASATPDLRLPSQPKLVLIAPTHGGMVRLSWPLWLVT